jgi:hypothetical protein
MSRTIAATCVAALVMAGCVSAGALSRKLEVGMTEKQVTALVGSEPQSHSCLVRHRLQLSWEAGHFSTGVPKVERLLPVV